VTRPFGDFVFTSGDDAGRDCGAVSCVAGTDIPATPILAIPPDGTPGSTPSSEAPSEAGDRTSVPLDATPAPDDPEPHKCPCKGCGSVEALDEAWEFELCGTCGLLVCPDCSGTVHPDADEADCADCRDASDREHGVGAYWRTA